MLVESDFLKSTISSNNNKEENEVKLMIVTKLVQLSLKLPEFSEDFYNWKRNYWKDRIGNIRNVVAPMVDQRFDFKNIQYRFLIKII